MTCTIYILTPGYVQFEDKNEQINRVNLNDEEKKKEIVCALSDFRENEKEEVWTCYISPQYIFCITELENGDAFLYQCDIKSKKQEKTLICNDPRCIGMMGD